MIVPKKVYDANVNVWPYECPIDRQLRRAWTAEQIADGMVVKVLGNLYLAREAKLPKKPPPHIRSTLLEKYREAGWRVAVDPDKPDEWRFYFPWPEDERE
jgi:hypothetical protein